MSPKDHDTAGPLHPIPGGDTDSDWSPERSHGAHIVSPDFGHHPSISSPTLRGDDHFSAVGQGTPRRVGHERAESISMIDPRGFTPTLHASLVSEILSLRRDIDARDALIGDLEHTLVDAKNENEELEDRLSHQNREFREVRRQLEQIEQSTVAALEELVQERDELKDGQTELRSKLHNSEQRLQSKEDEVRRLQEGQRQDRIAWDSDRRRLDQRVHIAESRLKTMLEELASSRVNAEANNSHPDTDGGVGNVSTFQESDGEDSDHNPFHNGGNGRSPTPSPSKRHMFRHSRNISSLSQRSAGRPFSRFSNASISSVGRANGMSLADELKFGDQADEDYDLSLLIEEDEEESTPDGTMRELCLKRARGMLPNTGHEWADEKAKRVLSSTNGSPPPRTTSAASGFSSIPPPLSDLTLSPRSATRQGLTLSSYPNLQQSGVLSISSIPAQTSPTRSLPCSILTSFPQVPNSTGPSLWTGHTTGEGHLFSSPTSETPMDPLRITPIEERPDEESSTNVHQLSRPGSKVLREVFRLEARTRISGSSVGRSPSHGRSSSATVPADSLHRRSISASAVSASVRSTQPAPVDHHEGGACKTCGHPLSRAPDSGTRPGTANKTSESPISATHSGSKTTSSRGHSTVPCQKVELSSSIVVEAASPTHASVSFDLSLPPTGPTIKYVNTGVQCKPVEPPTANQATVSVRFSAGTQTLAISPEPSLQTPSRISASTQTTSPPLFSFPTIGNRKVSVGTQSDTTPALPQTPVYSAKTSPELDQNESRLSIAIPSINVIPPASTPQSPHEVLSSPEDQELPHTQRIPISARSIGIQTDPIRIDQRILARLPPHLQKAAMRLRSSMVRGDDAPDSPPAQPVSQPRVNYPEMAESDIPEDRYPGGNDNGPLTDRPDNAFKGRRPFRSSSLFAGFDESSENAGADEPGPSSLPSPARPRNKSWQAAGKVPSAVPEDQEIGSSPNHDSAGPSRSGVAHGKSTRTTSGSLFRQPSIRRSAMIQSGTTAHINQHQNNLRSRSPSLGSNAGGSSVPPPFPVPNRISSRRPFSTNPAKSEDSCSPSRYGSIAGSSPSQGKSSRFASPREVLRKSRSAAQVTEPRRESSPSVSAGTTSSRQLDNSDHARRRSVVSTVSDRPVSTKQQRSATNGSITDPDGPNSVTSEGANQNSVVEAIASTMVGEWLWKYVRRKKSFTMQSETADALREENGIGGGQRHRRWVWLSPYERSVMWSTKQPTSGTALMGKGGRKLTIQSVLDVKDDFPQSRNGNSPSVGRSILVLTPSRALKFTAMTLERHYVWLTALSFLSHTASSLPSLASVAPLAVSSQQMVQAGPGELAAVPYHSTRSVDRPHEQDISDAADAPTIPRIHPSAGPVTKPSRHSRKRSMTGPHQHQQHQQQQQKPALSVSIPDPGESNSALSPGSGLTAYPTSTWHGSGPARRPALLSLRSAPSGASGAMSIRSSASTRPPNRTGSFVWSGGNDAAEPPPAIPLLQQTRNQRRPSGNLSNLNLGSSSASNLDGSGTVRMQAFISDQAGGDGRDPGQARSLFNHPNVSSDEAEIVNESDNDSDSVFDDGEDDHGLSSRRGMTALPVPPPPVQSRRRSFFNLLAEKLSPSTAQAPALPPPVPPLPSSRMQSSSADEEEHVAMGSSLTLPLTIPATATTPKIAIAIDVTAPDAAPSPTIFHRNLHHLASHSATNFHSGNVIDSSSSYYNDISSDHGRPAPPLPPLTIPRSTAFPLPNIPFSAPAPTGLGSSNANLSLPPSPTDLRGPATADGLPTGHVSLLSTRSSVSAASLRSSTSGPDPFKGF